MKARPLGWRITVDRLPAHVAAQVEVTPAGCWHWTGLLDPDGYARIMHLGQRGAGHRIVWQLLMGTTVPVGLVLHHRCHERDRDCPGGRACLHRACLRPAHVSPLTPTEHARVSARSGQAMKQTA